MLFRSTATALLCGALMACGGGDASSPATVAPVPKVTPRVEVTATGTTQSIDQVESYQLVVSGSSNTVMVAGDDGITVLSVTGNNNTVVLLDGASVNAVELLGSGNTVSLPPNQKPTVTSTGADNQVFNRF
jgi:hypothetical protein